MTMKFRNLFSLLCVLLSGCSMYASQTNRVASEAYLNKPMHLPADMMLAESKKWNLDTGRHWAFNIPSNTYDNNFINGKVPAYAEYQKNPELWQKWEGDTMSGWTRMVGVLKQGTKFHIVDIAPNDYAKSYWVTIEFDEGPYKNLTALYANPRNIIPQMYS